MVANGTIHMGMYWFKNQLFSARKIPIHINKLLIKKGNMSKDMKDKILGVIIVLLYCVSLIVLFFINAKVGIIGLSIVTAILIIRAFLARETN